MGVTVCVSCAVFSATLITCLWWLIFSFLFSFQQGDTIDDIPQAVIDDCAQLVKANSIQGVCVRKSARESVCVCVCLSVCVALLSVCVCVRACAYCIFVCCCVLCLYRAGIQLSGKVPDST